MTRRYRSILFLSGAGLPDWVWDGVRQRLDPWCDTRVAARPRHSGAALSDYAEAALADASGEQVVLVAHSAGGVVGAEIAGIAPERIGGLLAVSAVMPPHGGSFVTAMPIPNRWILGAAMRLAGTRPPESEIRRSLAHGLDDRTVDRLVADFAPESQAYYRDRIGERRGNFGRGYVTTTRDRQLSPALQRRFATRLGASWRSELPTGHLPMVEDPEALSAVIASFLESQP